MTASQRALLKSAQRKANEKRAVRNWNTMRDGGDGDGGGGGGGGGGSSAAAVEGASDLLPLDGKDGGGGGRGGASRA